MTPTTRRAALGALAGASALALPAVAVAAMASDADAELIALAAEIERLRAVGEEIYAERVDPFDETFNSLMDEALAARGCDPAHFEEHWAKAWAYSRESGRDAAVKERNEIDSQADRLWARMMAVPAASQAGRSAKVRALLMHVCANEWRGPACDLDWDKEQARALLAEFAGMTEEELAAI
jgi:hypothetical protein